MNRASEFSWPRVSSGGRPVQPGLPGTLALLLLFAMALVAAPPSAIAIRDARIVPVSGPVIDRGTVVLRGGLIEAVGANAAVPADAWVIDGKGLTIYPGLIDALSTLGLPDHAPQTESRRTGSGSPATPTPAPGQTPSPQQAAGGPEDRPSNTSWLRAADLLNLQDRRIESARNLGFTSAISFPTRGIVAGQGAVVNLAGERPGEAVVATPAGLYLALPMRGGAGFPGSLMGVMAYLRQLALDAEQYAAATKHYASTAAGRKRPGYDRASAGWLEAPRLLLPASTAVELERIIRFSAELKRPAVLYGGHAAYSAVPAIQKSGLPVLVSLKWPERERDTDPEDVDSLRTLELRRQAPSSPAALAKAGVPFALYPDNITVERDFKRAIKRALEAGLSQSDLVAALTLQPARIFGVADRIGSIEPGKIANLVVTDGELFSEKTKVKYVFVDGVKFEPLPETEETRPREETR